MGQRPREMPDMTPSQRWKNWWYYHWRQLLLGAAVAAILAGILRTQLTQARPDCGVALVTAHPLASEEVAAIQAVLDGICPDVNGDGRGSVALNVIQIDFVLDYGAEMDGGTRMVVTSNLDKLSADFYTRQSGIFLLEDPVGFQAAYEALEPGTIPWRDCPGAAEAALENCDGGALCFARRIAPTEEDRRALAGAAALWEELERRSEDG